MLCVSRALVVCGCLAFAGAACRKQEGGGAVGDSGTVHRGDASSSAGRDGDTSDAEAGAKDSGDTGLAGCTITSTAVLSPKMKTVAIVTWTTDLPGVLLARIEFGLTTSYGMVALVDLKAPNHRTLLLGMKQSRTYHYRVVAANGGTECASPDSSISTESLMGGLPAVVVSTRSTDAPLAGGFLLTGVYLPKPTGGMPAYILDADGDQVWAYAFPRDVSGVRMSYDGAYLWLNAANVPSTQGAIVRRVAMDGSTDEDLSDKFVGQNHQMAILPDETVAFYAYGSNGCEDIKEYAPATGLVRTLVNAGTAQGVSGDCHLTNIQYSRQDDTLVYSDLNSQAVVKLRRSDGATVWVLGGAHATIAGAPWKGDQHSLHLLGVDHFMLFNNNTKKVPAGEPGSGDGSIVLELLLDLGASTVAPVWSYKANPGIQNDVMGDVQRLPNGNTVIGYSYKGALQEVSSSGTVLQEWTWPLGVSFGYIEKRATLYGPPPR